MTLIQDHPDIEQLPLEIDGVPVRETIREFFRNRENGTPVDISKAGCLALALKSNHVGEPHKGYVVWNAWREAFPVVGEKNIANFQRKDFCEDRINFAGFVFGDRANFEGAKWTAGQSFRGAQWGNQANFEKAQWDDETDFSGASWGKQANFECARWGRDANFYEAHFGGEANFQAALWGRNANFAQTQWGDKAFLTGAMWDAGADFKGSIWLGIATFEGKTWEEIGTCHETKTRAEELGIHPASFGTIDFSGAAFLGSVKFTNRIFANTTRFGVYFDRQEVKRDENGKAFLHGKGELIFEDARDQRRNTIFAVAPNFHGCELHQDTSFEDARFPTAIGSEEAARAYRTLKLAFSKQQAIREEQRFFSLEMEEEKEIHRANGRSAVEKFQLLAALREYGNWLLYWSYKQMSDYGFSMVRPLILLILLWLLFAQFYGTYTGIKGCFDVWTDHCKVQTDWLNYSLQQALPLPGLEKLKQAIDGVSIAWVAVHKTLSVAAIFLIGLALRNLFKLK